MTNQFQLPVLTEGKMPRLAAIHDICGYGKCSLAVVLPVVSLAGVDVLPAPTSLVSMQTNIPGFAFMDSTSFLQDNFRSWDQFGLKVDGIYTGFLGSAEQIQIILSYIQGHPESFVLIDPVMGDHGKAYPTYTEEMCEKMKELVPQADLLVPNTTEASILLSKDYPGQNLNSQEAEALIDELLELGCKAVVLKGIQRDGQVFNCIKGQNVDYKEISHTWHDQSLHGTGDLFASCLCAGLFSGRSLEECVDFAGNFVYDSIVFSTSQEGCKERGVNFEPLLSDLVDFCGF